MRVPHPTPHVASPLRHRRYHPGHRYPQHLASTAKRWPLGPVFDHRALDVYRTISILLQVAGWLAFLACLYTLQAGKAARRVYKAEWASEANALAHRIDRALAPLDRGATLPQADERHQDSHTNPAPDRVVAFSDHALAKPLHGRIAIHPDQVQTVLNSTGTATNKLRALVNLPWRHSRGKGKHMSNSDIRSALASVLPTDLLAQLS